MLSGEIHYQLTEQPKPNLDILTRNSRMRTPHIKSNFKRMFEKYPQFKNKINRNFKPRIAKHGNEKGMYEVFVNTVMIENYTERIGEMFICLPDGECIIFPQERIYTQNDNLFTGDLFHDEERDMFRLCLCVNYSTNKDSTLHYCSACDHYICDICFPHVVTNDRCVSCSYWNINSTWSYFQKCDEDDVNEWHL